MSLTDTSSALQSSKLNNLSSTLDIDLIWQAVSEQLAHSLSQPSLEMWILPLKPSVSEAGVITLTCANAFSQNWIKRHYSSLLQAAFQDVLALEQAPDIDVVISDELVLVEATEQRVAMPMAPAAASVAPVPTTQATGVLNPKYQFEHYVIGEQNRLAHAAATAVANSPLGQSYNPLFIYGGVGLGKTHLMQAIGHTVSAKHPNLKWRYTTTEQFTNELIQAIATKGMKAFRERYRKIDLLMIDDVQFLEGKDRTQEELFHTFNTLFESGKQIILTSDRPPEKLSRLEERLRSRFACGLIADIQPADYETRVAILQRKSQQMKLALDNEVLGFIAETYPQNIRELEGALNKLSAYKMISGGEISLAAAQQLLGKPFDASKLSYDNILERVAEYFKLQLSDIKGSNRGKYVSAVRQAAIYVLREITDASYPAIGQALGGRKHSTVLYAYEKVKTDCEKDGVLKQQLREIISLIKNKA